MTTFRLFLLTIITVFVTHLHSHAQVPNGGFENWTTDTLYEDFPPYFTTNGQAYFSGLGPNVTKVPGVVGNAIRVESMFFAQENDTISGMILLGEPAENGVSGGWPYSDQPDSLIFYTRYNITAGDTAIVGIAFKTGGVMSSQHLYNAVGSQSSFTRIALPITGMSPTVDTIVFVISAGDFDNPAPNNWIEVDEALLKGSGSIAQFPNNDFETWVPVGFEEADGWFSSNIFNYQTNTPYYVTKSTDSYAGTYASRIESFAIDMGGSNGSDTLGFITTGSSIGEGGPKGGYPFTFQNSKLSFYYKYTPVGNDTAIGMVNISKYNTSTGNTDSVFIAAFLLPPVATYTYHEETINLSTIPDSANVSFAASNLADNTANHFVGSVLLVDEVDWSIITGGSKLVQKNNKPLVQLSPNPMVDYLKVQTTRMPNAHTIRVYNAKGQQILTKSLSSTTSILNTTNWSSGIYYIELTDSSQKIIQSVIKR